MTTFDPAHKHAKIILSNGNRTVSAPTASGDSAVNIRSTTGKSIVVERGYAEFRLDAITQFDDGMGGFVDGTVVVGVVNGTFVPGVGNLQGSANAVGYQNDGTVSVFGVATASGDSYSTGDTVSITVETDQSVTFKRAGGNSVTVDGSVLGTGTWYVAVQVVYQDDVWTGSFRDPFVRAPAWDVNRGGGGVAIRRFYRRST